MTDQAIVVALADAVVTFLNAPAPANPTGPGPFAQTFTAVRRYRPLFKPEDLKTIQVSVVPRGHDTAFLTRVQTQEDPSVDVAVQKKVASTDPDELDPLMLLVGQIAKCLRFQKFDLDVGKALWFKTTNTPIYSPDHLDQKGVFTSVLTFTFRLAA